MYSSVENVNIWTADSFDASLPETQNNEVDLVSKVEAADVLPSVPASAPRMGSATLPHGRPPLLSRPLSSVVMRPNSPPRPTRASSITTQDISGPQFVSSTNINLDSTLPLSRIRRGEFHGSGQSDNPELRLDDKFHSMTLPNFKSRPPQGISFDARDVGSRVDDVMSEVCFGGPSTGDGSVGFRRPHQSNPKGVHDEDNVYEEINSAPVFPPKIPPPDPPNSQKKPTAPRNLRGRKSQAGNSSGIGGTSPANLPAQGSSDKVKSGSTEKAGVRLTTGASDAKEHRVPRRPRQSGARSSSIRSSSAADDGTPATGSSNSDPKGTRKLRERSLR